MSIYRTLYPNLKNWFWGCVKASWVGLFFLWWVVIMAACGRSSHPTQEKKPLVLVSIAPYQFFAERIGGAYLDVLPIVPPGMNMHDFELTPLCVARLAKANLWFRIGETFETPLVSLVQQHGRVVDLRSSDDIVDLHMWLSVALTMEQVKKMARILSEQFPEHREAFAENLSGLLSDLESLDSEIRRDMTRTRCSTLFVTHPAFGYFCRDYSLEQVSIECEGKEVCPRDLEVLLRDIEQKKPEFILVLPQHGERAAERFAEFLHLPIERLDPYAYDYFAMMRSLKGLIVFREGR